MSSNIEITKLCDFCGNAFTARTTKTLFCSHTCASRAYKQRKRDEKVAASTQEVVQKAAKPILDIRNKEYLSISEACTLVGVSRWTIWRCIQNADIKAIKLGRRVIIRKADIEELFEPKYAPVKQPEPAITEWISVQELMAKYGFTRDNVYSHVKANKIPKRQAGRYVMLSKVHFDTLFNPTTIK